MEECTSQTKVISITLVMDTDQAMALWDLVGVLPPEQAEKYISNENYAKLYTLWKTLDNELSRIGLVD